MLKASMGNAVQKIRTRLVMEKAHQAAAAHHGMTAQSVFYSERSRSPDGRKSSTGSSSDASWTSARDDDPLDAALQSLDDIHDPHGTLSDLLARTGEDDFMKAVLSFCSYMDGRMDNLDNSKIYDEFRSYTTMVEPAKVEVA